MKSLEQTANNVSSSYARHSNRAVGGSFILSSIPISLYGSLELVLGAAGFPHAMERPALAVGAAAAGISAMVYGIFLYYRKT